MKKMKKSLKFVLISLCAVLVMAVAIVSTILLVRKTNETEPIERFTAKQQILLSDISQVNSIKKTETSKNLVEITSVRGENNEELSQDEIYGYFNGYFVALDENGNKILYVERGNKNVNILGKLLNEQKLKTGASNISAEKVSGDYLLYSYVYAENEKTFKTYEIVDFSNIDNLTILNKVSFELRDNKLYAGENQIKNLKINLLNGYFEVCYEEVQTSLAYVNETIDSEKYMKNIYVYGDSDLKQSIEYANSAEVLISETTSDNGLVIVKLSHEKAQFIYKTTNANGSEIFKSYDYEIDTAKNYTFYATNNGVYIEIRAEVDVQAINDAVMIDGKLYSYSYEFFNLKTSAIEKFNLSTGMVRASFASQGDFLIIFEQPRDYMSVSEWGALCYYDLNDELVLNYSASSIKSTIKYSNEGRFVTDDGIYVCKNETNAQLAFAFKSQQKNYVILSEMIDNDWFVVRDEVTKASYMLSIKGEIAFNEMFVSIVDFGEGYFLTSKNGKRHLCVPSENQKTLLENYTGFYEIYLPEFGMYLSEDGENLYTLYTYKNEVVENGVNVEVVARENYIALITTKNSTSKMYCLKLGENFGDNTTNFVTVQEISDDADINLVALEEICEYCNLEYVHSPDCQVINDVCCKDGFCVDCQNEIILQSKLNNDDVNFVSNIPYADSGTSECDGTNHKYTYEVTRTPTCNTEGIGTYTCSCGASYTVLINKLEHDYSIEVPMSEATCASPGHSAYTECSKCRARIGYEYYPPLVDDHDYEDESADATRNTTTLSDASNIIFNSSVSTVESGTDNSADQVISYSYPTKIYITQKGYSYYTDYTRYYATETIHCKNDPAHSYEHTYVSYTGLSSADKVTVNPQTYEITISESNGTLIASGGSWSVTITENFKNVGEGGTIAFYAIKTLVTAYSPSLTNGNFSYEIKDEDIAYYQPQEKINYDVVFHRDTPYYETEDENHNHLIDTNPHVGDSNEGDFIAENIPYFHWSDENKYSGLKDGTGFVSDSEYGFQASLYAAHYEWVGWTKGSTYTGYILNNDNISPLEMFDGYALGVQFTSTTQKVNLWGIFKGSLMTISFTSGIVNTVIGGSTTKILLRIGDEYVMHTLEEEFNEMANGNLIDKLDGYVDIKEDAFINVKPEDLHSTIIEKANEINNASNHLIATRNYVHEGWAVWDSMNSVAICYYINDDGTIISKDSYDNFIYVSGTYGAGQNSIKGTVDTSGNTVRVMALYRQRTYGIDANEVTNSNASWRGTRSDDSSLDLSDSFNETAVGYANDTTINWSYTNSSTSSDWTSLADELPKYSATTGVVYINIAIKIEGHETFNSVDAIGKLYRFSTITFNYGSSQTGWSTRKFELEYTDSTWNWEKTESGGISNDIVVAENNYKSHSKNIAMVTFKLTTLTPVIDNILLLFEEKGYDIEIGSLVPMYEVNERATYEEEGTNVTFNATDVTDSVEIFNVREDTSDIATIKGANGSASYYAQSFAEDVTGARVDTQDYYDNTHMMVIKPKTQYLYNLGIDDETGNATSRLITSNYISKIAINKANTYFILNTGISALEEEYLHSSYLTLPFSISANYENILEYHNKNTDAEANNTIDYGGKTYQIISGERCVYSNGDYYIYFDLYVGKATRAGSQSPYEDDYAYFLFYGGKVSFTITMTDIIFGDIEVEQNTGTYSAETARSGDYQNYTNYADWNFIVKNSNYPASSYNTALNNVLITSFNKMKIQPTDGFLIEEVTVTLLPKNGEFTQPLKRTYTIDYTNSEKIVAVTLNNSENLDTIRYKYEDSEITFEGKTLTILDFVDLRFSAPGYTDGGGWTAANANNYGTVWLGMSKVIDNITISYKVVSYLDVLFKQFKDIDVYSYLKKDNLNTSTFNSANYQSDFDIKAGTWFNDTALTQIYISGSDEAILDVPNPANSSHSDNYYYNNKKNSVSDYANSAIAYNKITGYLLNGNSYITLVNKNSEAKIGTISELLGSEFDNEADTVVPLSLIRNAVINLLTGSNIGKSVLMQNCIKAYYYSDPVAYTIKYGTKTETLYYDQEYTLDAYENVSATGYKEKEGYSFVGWVSNGNYEVTGGTDENLKMTYDSNYGYLFTCEDALAELIGSSWYFGRTQHDVALYSRDKDGNIVNSETVYSDFYVDQARFISDTGYYKSGQVENYNFLCVGQLISGHERFANDGSGEYVLYPVWMANDYALKFTLNDSVMEDIDTYGSTETLFRINDTTFDYLKNTYTANLNNGFNFKLTYNGGATYNNLKLQVVDGVNVAAVVPEFYVYVRYDTKEWYFSNSDGSRLIYYQDFFIDGTLGEVNADRYGYTFAQWIMKNNDPFTEAQLFNSEFYNNCEIVEINKLYYSYKSNPYKSVSSTTKAAYTYGNNGELFEIAKREINDAEYKGCKVEHFVTNRLTENEFRTATIEADWTINKYYIRLQKYDTYDFEFADGASYPINDLPITSNDMGDFYLSSEQYVFDSDEYNGAQNNICDILLQIPYRHGYDFAGWTFAYDKMDDYNINDISKINPVYENYWYEQLIYKDNSSTIRQYQGLCDDLLRYYNYYKVDDASKLSMNEKIEHILFYSETTQGEGTAELLGDLDTGKAHYVNFYANWTPMIYSIEVDLNIPEGYEDISSELFAGLFEQELQLDGSYKHVLENGIFANGIAKDGFRVDENGIAFFNYMKDNKTYKATVSNTSFKIYYGMKLGEAYLELTFDITDDDGNLIGEESVRFGIADLYIKLNNNNFLGWKLFGYNSSNVWTQISIANIILDEKYLANYADNFRQVSSYGDVLVYENGSWVRRAILRDVVVEDNNIDGEEIVTERLYVERMGERYYLEKVDHFVSENLKNENWNFSDEYLIIVVDGKEYYLYENENYGFYVIDAFKEEFDENGNLIEKNPAPTTNIVEISGVDKDSLLSGINSSIINELRIRKYRKFEIEATWSEINANAIDYDLNIENANNSSTGKITYKGEIYNVYYKETLNIDTGFVSKNLYIQVLKEDGVYQNIPLLWFSYKEGENALKELGFNDKYLTYDGQNILINSDGKPYYNRVEANGTVTPTILNGLFYAHTAVESLLIEDITQMHDFTGNNQYANPGLTGAYSIKTDSKAEIKTNSEIVDNADGTYTENGLDEFELSASFEYNETAYITALPYYNGRYLTEISFEFKHIFEDETIRKSFTDVGLANYVDVRLVFDLFWDSENRTIGIEKVELYRRDQEEVLCTIKRKEELRGYTVQKDGEGNIISIKFKDYTNSSNPTNTDFGYYDWWRTEAAIDTENSKRYDKLLDFIDSYFGFMLPEDGELTFEEFISIGRYIDTEETQEKVEGREDVNVVNLTLKELKKPMTLAMKFSVQTFEVNVYSVLNDNYDQALKTEGVIQSPYYTLGELEEDIDYTNTMISKDYDFNIDDEEYPKFAMIIGDSDASGEKKILEAELEKNQIIAAGGEVPEEDEGANTGKFGLYNVPYGYFAYGYNLDSSYVGDRPIDTEENKKLIANPLYGYSYIYLNNLYYYKDSDLLFTAANSDLINSKALKETEQKPTYDGENINLGINSPMIGDPEKFLQSVRADKELIYYNFGGLFFIDNKETVTADGRVYFRGVSQDDEKSYINKNYHIYAYYYVRTTATEAGFYAWDDVTSSYQKIEDINDGYAYYKLDKDEYYAVNEDNVLEHVDGKPTGNIMYTFKEVGIDTEKFAGDFDYVPNFGDDELETEYLEYLKLVSETYWFICNDGVALLNGVSELSGLMYNQKSKMYYDANDNYYALVQQRNLEKTYYGATLYKKTLNKSQTINKTNYDLYEKVTDINAFNPEFDDVTDYVVFKDYYVLYKGEYYKIETYSEEKFGGTYYSPLVEYFVDNNGTHYGNSVKLPTGVGGQEVTYYFNYETQKLYQPNQLGVEVEVTDFSYQIKTPVNDNYDVSVIERSTGFGLYGISLSTIPDSSVSYWMPDREFLFWAGITQEELNSILQYEADMTSEAGKVYTTLLNQFKLLNSTEDQIKAFMDELNEKLKTYTFKDLISAGVLVKQFYYNNDTHAVERVELEFVVDLGEFESLQPFTVIYSDLRMPINTSTDFDILEAGSAMVSSLYGIQVYKRINFEINSYASVDADTIDKDYFELYGDSIYYYTEKFGDFVRFAELSYAEHIEMLNATDKAATLDSIINSNADNGVDIVKALDYVTKTERVDENGDIVYDQYGNVEYNYSYNTVTRSSSSKYLYAFYYKANMPEGSEPYVVAVAKH